MPDAFELPGMLRAIVPLMRRERPAGRGRCVINEFVAFCERHSLRACGRFAGFQPRLVPRFAAIIGSLNYLAEEAAALGYIDAVRVGRRAVQVIDLPTTKVRALNIPLVAFAIRSEDERTFSRTYKKSNATQLIHIRVSIKYLVARKLSNKVKAFTRTKLH
jgi:hypothetical protein